MDKDRDRNSNTNNNSNRNVDHLQVISLSGKMHMKGNTRSSSKTKRRCEEMCSSTKPYIKNTDLDNNIDIDIDIGIGKDNHNHDHNHKNGDHAGKENDHKMRTGELELTTVALSSASMSMSMAQSIRSAMEALDSCFHFVFFGALDPEDEGQEQEKEHGYHEYGHDCHCHYSNGGRYVKKRMNGINSFYRGCGCDRDRDNDNDNNDIERERDGAQWDALMKAEVKKLDRCKSLFLRKHRYDYRQQEREREREHHKNKYYSYRHENVTNIKHCRQHETWDCGVLCIQMVLRWIQRNKYECDSDYRHEHEHEHDCDTKSSMMTSNTKHTGTCTGNDVRNRQSQSTSTSSYTYGQFGGSAPLTADEIQQKHIIMKALNTQSIWTIDLVVLLHNILSGDLDLGLNLDASVDVADVDVDVGMGEGEGAGIGTGAGINTGPVSYLFCSNNMGVDSIYRGFNYYQKSFRRDERRVRKLFQLAHKLCLPMYSPIIPTNANVNVNADAQTFFPSFSHKLIQRRKPTVHSSNSGNGDGDGDRDSTGYCCHSNSDIGDNIDNGGRLLSMKLVLEMISNPDVIAICLIDDHVLRRAAPGVEPILDWDGMYVYDPPSLMNFAGHYVIICGAVPRKDIDIKEDDEDCAILEERAERLDVNGCIINDNGYERDDCGEWCSSEPIKCVDVEVEEEDSSDCFLVVKNPGSSVATEFIAPSLFERAWRAQGTDQDIIFIALHKD